MSHIRRAAGVKPLTEQKMVGAWIPRPIADKSAIAIRALKYKNMREFILTSLNRAITEAQKQGYPLEGNNDDSQLRTNK